MELILWRHAQAEDGLPDLPRALTEKGQRQARQMAGFLRPRLPENTRILVSPATRAQQTARALTDDFITDSRLAPDAQPQALLNAAGWPTAGGCVLIVGHQPTLGQLAALLLTGNAGELSIRKGAIWWFSRRARLTGNDTALRLVMPPDLLPASAHV